MQSIKEFILHSGLLNSYHAKPLPQKFSLSVSKNGRVLSVVALHNGSSFAVKAFAQIDDDETPITKEVGLVKDGELPEGVGWNFLNSFVLGSGTGPDHQEEAYHAYVKIL